MKFKFCSEKQPKFKKALMDNKGSFNVIFALALIPFLGLVGGSVDYTNRNQIIRDVQDALDSSLLAAAAAEPNIRMQTAQDTFALNFAGTSGVSVTPTFNFAENDNRSFQEIGTLSASVSGSVDTYFMRLLGVNQLNIGVTSAVGLGGPPPQDVAPKECIYVLDSIKSQAFRMNSQALLHAPECDVQIHTNADSAINLNSNIDLDVRSLCVAGFGGTDNTNGQFDNLINYQCDPLPDPYENAFVLPTIGTCDFTDQNFDTNLNGVTRLTLKPGTYCLNNLNLQNNIEVTLQPGIYILAGGTWNVNTGVSFKGEGVTFYYTSPQSYLNFNSASQVRLTAPTEGDYANVLFMEEKGRYSGYQININSAVDFEASGLWYLPNRPVHFNSRTNFKTVGPTTFVFDEFTIDSSEVALSAPPVNPNDLGDNVVIEPGQISNAGSSEVILLN